MKKVKDKKEAQEAINNLFSQAEKKAKKNASLSKRYIQLAKKIAMKFNLKLSQGSKKKYCHHCYSFFTPNNCKTRIKSGMRIVYCLKCRHYNRTKLKSKLKNKT